MRDIEGGKSDHTSTVQPQVGASVEGREHRVAGESSSTSSFHQPASIIHHQDRKVTGTQLHTHPTNGLIEGQQIEVTGKHTTSIDSSMDTSKSQYPYKEQSKVGQSEVSSTDDFQNQTDHYQG